eukprot:UN02748
MYHDSFDVIREQSIQAERMTEGVRIRNLTKEFYDDGKTIKAVDSFSLDLKKGEMFVLLGHNGAGKSTLINCLTGMYSPTKGDAFIDNKSIRNDMKQIRQRLGVCPQHSILWKKLNCREHLWFFARLKGLPVEGLEESITECLTEVGLESRQLGLSQDLSGGEP